MRAAAPGRSDPWVVRVARCGPLTRAKGGVVGDGGVGESSTTLCPDGSWRTPRAAAWRPPARPRRALVDADAAAIAAYFA
jgi:hypothetical protein